MRFRTEIETSVSPWKIAYDTPVLLLGSCFTDEIGERLSMDGFNALHNPFGALYNPVSVARCLRRAVSGEAYTAADLVAGPRGFHCLDYATRFSDPDVDGLLDLLNGTMGRLRNFLALKPAVILTLGSAFVFHHKETDRIVGNCHKFPANSFLRRKLTVEEVSATLSGLVDVLLEETGVSHLIFTVSPIRHLADGLHGNTLSKSTLMLGIDDTVASRSGHADYFPSYEIMLDDLRDYRFYADDMKHPSQIAVDYIYQKFSETYFSKSTMAEAAEGRRRTLAARHRPILT